jgi:hypothetical protein
VWFFELLVLVIMTGSGPGPGCGLLVSSHILLVVLVDVLVVNTSRRPVVSSSSFAR